jgi:hypothetical protein
MSGKVLATAVFLVAIGAALLGMRQYRQTLRHDVTRLHEQMNESRQAVWDLHVRIAERIEPKRLKAAIDRAGLELEPITPGPASATGRADAESDASASATEGDNHDA